jgi:hypothetical protein
MKALIFSLWKYFHPNGDSFAIGGPDVHPTVGIYSTLCSLEQGKRGKGRY